MCEEERYKEMACNRIHSHTLIGIDVYVFSVTVVILSSDERILERLRNKRKVTVNSLCSSSRKRNIEKKINKIADRAL